MATVNSTTTLEGLFKRIYADKLLNLIPDNAKLVKDISFSQNNRLGDTYEQPVVLTNEHGFTYSAAGNGAFDLNAAIAMTTKNARVPSVQVMVRSQIDYESASKASSGGEQAFRKSTELIVKNMMDSFTHRLEASILYGNSGIGTTASSANASSTSTVVTFSAASWAIGMWAGSEGAKLNFYNTTVPVGNADATNADAVFVVTAVDVANKAITVSGTATGIAALDTEISGSAASVKVYWFGSYGTADMYGIDTQITNTGSLFGINASSYHLFQGNSVAIGGALTLAKFLDSTTLAIGKGLRGDVTAYISPMSFADLNAEVSAYQRLDHSYSKEKENWGTQELALFAQNGLIRVVPHTMVKGGEGFIFPLDCVKRIGSTDITFNNPGMGDKFFRELTDKAGFELRAYSDQTIFIDKPAVTTKLTGITY